MQPSRTEETTGVCGAAVHREGTTHLPCAARQKTRRTGIKRPHIGDGKRILGWWGRGAFGDVEGFCKSELAEFDFSSF